MENEDLIKHPTSSHSGVVDQKGGPSQSSYEATQSDFLPLDSDIRDTIDVEATGIICNDPCESVSEPIEADSRSLKSDVKDEIKLEVPEITPDNPRESGCEADNLPLNTEVKYEMDGASVTISDGLHENIEKMMTTDIEKDEDNNTPLLPVGLESTESVVSIEKTMTTISSVHAENGSVAVQSESSLSYHEKNENLLNGQQIDASPLSGVKRRRVSSDGQQPSVHIIYNSLTRDSKRKLEELLQQWSQWHVLQRGTSSNASDVVLESGEETYFPALRVDLDKPSAVTFWVDDQTRIQSSKEFTPLDGTSVPLYDRGYSLALTSADGSSGLDGGLDKLDSSRCFNCGSYSHALKDCSKPRDNVAVNNARKQHRSKRNQHANSRNSTRYYQSSRGGKYDGLVPGVLDPETRKALGVGELDPPPWLTRMREIGYPPGYLEPDETDQPSGITIFGEETIQEESEEGEILGASDTTKLSRKMTVEFPGINAPIPENADERLWATGSSSFNLHRDRDRSHRRYDHSSEYLSRSHHYREQRFARDFDDEGPPGCDPGTSPSLSYHYRRYADHDSNYTSLSPQTSPWSPSYGRSLSDRGRRSPLVHDGSPNYGHYGSYQYSSPR